ncbi:MAG: TRAP transporter small permease [Desulfobacter sp.]|nr:TRAP transporter small permease [Desulfobacter sp.]WDP87046.1 MAG: TRAP transporter small permease [Desulfobacter sp.]
MISFFNRISDLADRISLFGAVVAILLILAISIYGAFFRYVLNDPLPWPLPVERLLMIWAALLGIPAALKRGQHMGVEGLISRLPLRVEIAVRYVNYCIIALFIVCLGWFGWLEFLNSNDLYMISADTRISSRWFTIAVPISALIQGIHLLSSPVIIRRQIQARKEMAD